MVDQILGRPVAVTERVPRVEFVVLNYGVLQLELLSRRDDVLIDLLELELRRVDSKDDQAVVRVFVMPGLDVWQCAYAVDAGVCPEVDEYDLPLSLHIGEQERIAVDPLLSRVVDLRRHRIFKDGHLRRLRRRCGRGLGRGRRRCGWGRHGRRCRRGRHRRRSGRNADDDRLHWLFLAGRARCDYQRKRGDEEHR